MPAAAIVGSAVVGAVASNQAAKKGAKAAKSAAASNERLGLAQLAENRRQYDLSRMDQAPWRNYGQRGLIELGGLMGIADDTFNQQAMERYRNSPLYIGEIDQLESSPGYQFRLGEGLKSIERSALSRGMGRSGATLKALQRYGEGLAADEYNNYYNRVSDSFNTYANRLAGMAGVGQTANQSLAQLGLGYQGQNAGITQNLMSNNNNLAASRASGYMQNANNIANAINQGVGMYGLYRGGYFGSSGGNAAGGSTPGPVSPSQTAGYNYMDWYK